MASCSRNLADCSRPPSLGQRLTPAHAGQCETPARASVGRLTAGLDCGSIGCGTGAIAHTLVASGTLGAELAAALKAEARRRVAAHAFFGHVAYASLTARKHV